jgi:FtsP/CotA-like multicopper oxidase with cupredoxin domain
MRHPRDESRSTRGLQFVVSLLSILAICQVGYSQQAASNMQQAPPATAAQTSGASAQIAGNAFSQPNEIRSVGGVLNVTLNLAVAPNTIAGRVLETATYNGLIPGPTLRVRPGDVFKIRLINNLTLTGAPPPTQKIVDCGHRHSQMFHSPFGPLDPMTFLHTNLHTHGLQVSPLDNGDNVLIDLAPGETCDYSIPIPLGSNVQPGCPGPYCPPQPAGLFWYHPHRHESTSKQSWAGLAGAIIVEGDIDRVPEVAAARERLMVLQELWVDDKGNVPSGMVLPVAGSQGTQTVVGTEVPFTPNPVIPTNIYYVVNGVFQPEIPFQPGETQRWRILNASPHRVYQLYLEGNPEIYKIAQDGIAFGQSVKAENTEGKPSCWASGNLCLAPGNRVEVIVKFPENADATQRPKLWAVAFEQGHPGGALPRVVLATLAFAGPPVTGRKIPDKLVTPPPDITESCKGGKMVTFGPGNILTGPVAFPINGKLFTTEMTPMTGKVDTCEEWTLINADVFMHPFHIHVNPFQVTEVNGVPLKDVVWWDTVMLPPKGKLKIRTRYRKDVMGLTVFHCHFLPHEDNGMMTLFQLVR